MGCHFLLQGIFLIQGLNPGLPHCRRMLLPSKPPGNPQFCHTGAFTLQSLVHLGGQGCAAKTKGWSMAGPLVCPDPPAPCQPSILRSLGQQEEAEPLTGILPVILGLPSAPAAPVPEARASGVFPSPWRVCHQRLFPQQAGALLSGPGRSFSPALLLSLFIVHSSWRQ